MTNSAVATAEYVIRVATPTFSPAAGTYTEAQNVTISCTTSGATIYYTTDGSTPSTSSSVYSSAIPVSSTTTIKAIAVKSGMDNSTVASATYTINLPHTVTFNAGNGTCSQASVTEPTGTSITLPTATPSTTCADAGWTFAGWATSNVDYTTTAPTLYTDSYTINGDATLYAVYSVRSFGEAFNNSGSGDFIIYAAAGNTNYYANGSISNSKIGSTTSASEAAVYTFEKPSGYGDGEYAIKIGTKYIKYTGNTDLGTSNDPYKWAISEGVHGTWRVASGTTGRALIFRAGTSNQFGGYATSNITGEGEYFDLEIGGVGEAAYATSPDCTDITVSESSLSFLYEGGTGSFDFTVSNPISGATASASTTASWITNVAVSGNTVNFQVAQNDGLARSGEITLTYAKNGTTLATATVTINQDSNPVLPGGADNPYTVAQAVAATPSSGTSDLVYVKGVVSQIVEIEVMQYHNARYYISDDGSTSSTQLLAFYGRNINNTDFLSEDELFVGDEVVICGQLQMYNDKAELGAGNYIVYLHRDIDPVTFSPVSCVTTSGTYVSLYSNVFDEWDAEIYYTTDGNEPSRSNGTYYDVWSDLITLTETTTIKAVAYVPDLDKYSSVTQSTYTIVDPSMHGWVGNPYSVSQAIDAINAASGNSIKGAYVQGTISRISQIELEQYFNATYFISDNGLEQNELQVYRGKYLSQGDFSSLDDIQVGDQVIVYGDLTLYDNTTHEFKPKNYIYDLQRSSSIIINQNHLDVDCNATAGTIAVSYSADLNVNIDIPTVQLCDAQGNAASYDWLSVSLNQDDEWNLEYAINANDGASSRTAYLKVSCQNVVSNLVTITQSEYQPDFATLPFTFDGGLAAAESTTGLKPAHLGSDYSSSPKLKFNNPNVDGNITMSSLVLKINEVPGTLVYDIKANPSSGTWTGIFKVQSSADGLTWVDQVVYNNNNSNCAQLGNSKQTDIIVDLPNATRYIRWIYTTRSNGNVALGNIILRKPTVYYDIVLNQPQEGGTISSSMSTAAAGETVSLEAVNDEGYVLAEWNVLDEDQQPVAVADPYALVTSFVMPASDVTVEASFVSSTVEFQYAYSVNGTLGATQTETVGTILTLPNSSNISGLPFTFIGWSTDANNVENVMSAGTSYRLSRNVTFYAVYAETVAGSVAVKHYARVTSDLEANWAGDYLIAFSSSIFADGRIGGTSSNGIGQSGVSVNPEDNLHDNMVETLWGDVYHVTLEEVSPGSNTYLLKTQDGKYNYHTNNTSNGLKATDTRELAMNYPITVNFESADDIRLSLGGDAEGSVFRYNPDGFFRFYKNGGQEPVYLYKKTVNVANRYTRVFVDNPTGGLTIVGPSIIPNGSVLNVASITNTLGADKLVIEEGAQLVTFSDVNATIKRFINPYQGDSDNYYLIASPVDDLNPTTAGMTVDNFDLYAFDQEAQGEEWQNYKADNFNLAAGQGYLYANDYGGFINMGGIMAATANGVTITKVSGKPFAGWNLIGNPYPCNVTINKPFYRLAEGGAVLATEATDNTVAIAPMEGVFVYADVTETVSFAKAPTTSTTGGRNLLSMRVSRNRNSKDDRVDTDNAIVRFGEGDMLRKLVLNPDLSQLYVAQDGTDYAIVNAEAEGELPVSFRAATNGSYTLSVAAEGVTMRYLHLIDLKTGADIDLLQTPYYTFTAQTTDYESRFRLVFATGSSTSSETGNFAYYNGSQWVVSSEADATLQVIDVMGRVLSSQTVNGNAQVSIDRAAGVYLLRLINGSDVKVQKIVIH